jgi:hypothetical protein
MTSSRYKRQFVPPPDPHAEPRAPLSAQDCIRAFIQLMDEEDAQFRADLQVLVGPKGDIGPLYRIWHELMQDDSDRAKEHMLLELSRREDKWQTRQRLRSD